MTLPLKVTVVLAVGTALGASAPESPVIDAARRGDVEAVRTLLRAGADVNAAQGDGMTALHWGALNADEAIVEVLAYAGANLEAATRLGQYRPLHLASRRGHGAMVRQLLEAGADEAAWTGTGVRPIHLAAEAGNVDAVAALIEHGADVNIPDRHASRTPLMFATAGNRLPVIDLLLEAGANVASTTRTVDYTDRSRIDSDERRARARLIAAAVDPDQPDSTVRGPGPAPSADPDRPTGSPPPEARSGPSQPRPLSYADLVGQQGGLAPLHFAVRDGLMEAAVRLLDAGADVNQVTGGDGSSPLLISAINGNYDLAMLLLRRGADPNLTSEDGAGPLFAALNGRWALRTWYPQPTAWQQQETAYLDLLRALLEAGADPNARVKTHIWYAAYNAGRMGVDFGGATPFWRAAYSLDVDAMRLLVEFGADPEIRTVKPAGRIRGGSRAVADSTAEADPSGLPPVPVGGPAVHPLHAASGVGYGTSRIGQQHQHVPDGWLPAVRYLVEELGVDVNVRDHDGYSAVHHAAARGDNATIRFLVEHGADVTSVSRRGQTTVDMANGPQQRVQPFPETIALLENLGAVNNHNCQSC